VVKRVTNFMENKWQIQDFGDQRMLCSPFIDVQEVSCDKWFVL